MSGLTGQHSEAADYEFTTLTSAPALCIGKLTPTAVPGVMQVNGASIQILDLPGIIAGAADGKGRGRQVIAVARSCNLIFIVLDVLKPLADKAVLEAELYDCGIRLNVEPPQVQLKKKEKGALVLDDSADVPGGINMSSAHTHAKALS